MCAQIAGLQDFRGEGPPGDMGVFQAAASVIVYQFTFSGTTYIVAQRMGVRGWTLVSQGTVAATVIQAAVNELTDGGSLLLKAFTTFIITVQINLLSNILIRGEGENTELKCADNTQITILRADNKSNITIRDLKINGNKANNTQNPGPNPDMTQNAIYFETCTYCKIIRVHVLNTVMHGAVLHNGSNYNVVEDSRFESCGEAGAFYNSQGGLLLFSSCYYNKIMINYFSSNFDKGLYISNACQSNIVTGNNFFNEPRAIHVVGNNTNYNIISGNNIVQGGAGVDGIYLDLGTMNYNVISTNTIYDVYTDGIYVGTDGQKNLILGNTIYRARNHGIEINGQLNTIEGNTIFASNKHGIIINAVDCIVKNNFSYQNSQFPNNTYDNINLTASASRAIVTENVCDGGTSITRTGIYVTGSCSESVVKDNRLSNHATANFVDLGTNTRLAAKIFQFIQGGNATGIVVAQFISAVGSAKGWEIDAADEWVIALGTLPLEVQQVVRIKIWAVGLAAPGAANQMRADFAINAGQPDEIYTGETIIVASKEGDQTNFSINDVITWTLNSTDDADIGHLVGGDCLEARVDYRVAVAPDIETDAVFRCIEIQYV